MAAQAQHLLGLNMQAPQLVQLSHRVLKDRNSLRERLHESPLSFVPDEPMPRLSAIVDRSGASETELPSGTAEETWRQSAQEEVLRAAGSALAKIESDGEAADFSASEATGLEAIIHLVGRPAIFVQEGRFFPPPSEWSELEDSRADIEAALAAIGRVEVTGHPNYDWVGTGFLVADDLVMTNEHVAREFASRERDAWTFRSGMASRVDFREELGTLQPLEFDVLGIADIHPTLDLALLRVSRAGTGGASLARPLPIASQAPVSVEARRVYTVGYPAWDGRRNDPDAMRRIFSGTYNVKRLQPGEVTGMATEVTFLHDCSTLGGNSGSAVLDLETHRVVGLHFSGRYMGANRAIALWGLVDDPILRGADLSFV